MLRALSSRVASSFHTTHGGWRLHSRSFAKKAVKKAAAPSKLKRKIHAMDGNTAAAYVAYNMSDTSFIYPITPSSPMGELADQWAGEKKRNVFGDIPTIRIMQSEGSEFQLEVDQFVIAIGNGSNPMLTKTFPELKLNKWGNIRADSEMRTSVPGVFAGGDIVTGAATVIEAMGAGKIAATAIDKYFEGATWDVKL